MIALRDSALGIMILPRLNEQRQNQFSIDQKIEDLTDIIASRMVYKTLEEVEESVKDKIFALRVEILHYFFESNFNINDYRRDVNALIANQIQIIEFNAISSTVAEVLELQDLILNEMPEIFVGKSFSKIVETKPNYASIEFLLEFYPIRQSKNLKNWIDASLKLEFGLLIYGIILNNKISFSASQTIALKQFLRNAISLYGAYSIVNNIWRPSEKYDNQLITNMKILAATIELDTKPYEVLDENALTSLFN